MFKPIIHNTDDQMIEEYNRLIQKKPTGGANLAEKLELQKAWKERCNELLTEIREKYV